MTDDEFVSYVVDGAAEVYGPCFPHVEQALRCSCLVGGLVWWSEDGGRGR
jgi:hypothetical protein